MEYMACKLLFFNQPKPFLQKIYIYIYVENCRESSSKHAISNIINENGSQIYSSYKHMYSSGIRDMK